MLHGMILVYYDIYRKKRNQKNMFFLVKYKM